MTTTRPSRLVASLRVRLMLPLLAALLSCAAPSAQVAPPASPGAAPAAEPAASATPAGPASSAAPAAGATPKGEPTCYESKWGPNDQIGALNNITADNVLAAAKLVTRGKSIRMGIETNSKTPAFPPRTFSVTILTPGQEYGGTLGETKTNYNDDIIMGWVGVGSQLDGLGHIGIDGVYYNCSNGREFVSAGGLKKFGIETVPAIATRAVILDMVGLTGQDPVREGTAFNRREIDAALQRQGNMKINKGDVVIFYTGWSKLIGKDDKRYGSVEPGLGVEGAHYLASLGVALVGADSWGLEVVPFEDPNKIFHVHQILIAQNGIMLLENVNAEEAVKDRVYEGLFTLGPSRVTGAVQAIINPIFLY